MIRSNVACTNSFRTEFSYVTLQHGALWTTGFHAQKEMHSGDVNTSSEAGYIISLSTSHRGSRNTAARRLAFLPHALAHDEPAMTGMVVPTWCNGSACTHTPMWNCRYAQLRQ